MYENYNGLLGNWNINIEEKKRAKSKISADVLPPPPIKWMCVIQDKNKCNNLTLNLSFCSLLFWNLMQCNECVILQTWHQLWSSTRFSILYWPDYPNRVDILYSPSGSVHCSSMGWALEIGATAQSMSDLGEVYLKQTYLVCD